MSCSNDGSLAPFAPDAYAAGAKGASEPSLEQLMRRLQIEFHRVRRG